ncbi:MAG: Enolase [Candidatus Yanofskybacteria bacterium GW2011_GWA1_44_21]|uniref:Enolase n=3 Tax=Parcubacteria group TaxID=1794811 RepID=A0A0G0XJW7_9BACT|nr:MAG: Enolase [Candidatus Wolfebacteria bacterium GW2011_GWA2_42_10]KKT50097.1 MAG: Enolase [Candidatus Yanofskybacteria bacterium GW2011_GWA1_44_21]KKT90079.1 MAG: Enolase [Candidatus Yanofskybacteria bacterium GW2011_GWB1_45_11]OGN02849.1 MAG: hypothetical protein A2657_02135 [Candidatus Yanofskybacteria bacterium RIFCSPHIGHO2_01_FULL_44_110b]OGN14100.1 MAG: hypothetical protein A3C01_00685 [Candidatus Yanofskybacteria bacterium RIFCSPHIGHO2_02_FULL_44_36b]OGN19295.1 MAG: hypothetical prot
MRIRNISVEKILNSRSDFTISVTVVTENGRGTFSVPSGASTGSREAHEIKDINRSIANINGIVAPKLIGADAQNQSEIDSILQEMDGSQDKSNLGGNVLIGVSVACAKAAAKSLNLEPWQYLRGIEDMKTSRPVPYLFFNLINGGKHARSKLPFQEYHIVPQTMSVSESLEISSAVMKNVRDIVASEMSQSYANLGDEGGVTIDTGEIVDTDDVKKPLQILTHAIQNTGYSSMTRLSMDVAASTFYMNNSYQIGGMSMTASDLATIYSEMTRDFDIMAIEDPFEENDFVSFRNLKNSHSGLYVVGDDLTVTNPGMLNKALKEDSINSIIIKPNQIGTLTETLQTMKIARENNIECIVSHRSGETDDDFIADLSYAFGCFGLKAGAPNRGERIAKYNRLLHISTNA